MSYFIYCINTSEIPGKLSHVNMISSHVKITCYFTRENNMLFSQMKRFPLLWLHNPLDLLLCDRNIIFFFGNLRKLSENVRKRSSGLPTFFKESSEIFGKSSKTSSLVFFSYFSCSTRYLTSECSKRVRYRVEHLKIKFVSTRGHVISSIFFLWKLPCIP